MRQWKKVMASVLSLALILTSFYVSPKSVEAAATQIYAENVMAKPGDVIEIPVKIKGNTGIMGFDIDVHYDKEVLKPIDDVKTSDLLAGTFENGVQGALDKNADSFNVVWAGTDNMTENGVLFTLKFQVSAQAVGIASIALAVREEDCVYNEEFVNIPVDCQPITVAIDGNQPDHPTKPPKAPSLPPAETKNPDVPPVETKNPDLPPVETDKPAVTSEPSEIETVEIYLTYVSDANRTQEIGDTDLDKKVMADGNGEYQFSFVSTAATDNIYRLCLHTFLEPEDLPEGMQIVPTTLQVGEKTYAIGKCVESNRIGYWVTIQDILEEIDNIEGDVPVDVGDTVTLKFRIEGMKRDGTSGISTNSPAPTKIAAVQNTDQPAATKATATKAAPTKAAATKAAATKKPSRTSKPYPRTTPVTVKKPKKVNLKKVKALGKGKARVSWKWFLDQDGFQLQYAQNRSFTKKKKTKKKSAYKNTATIKKLKKGKTYYFRVRAFCKSGSRKKYGKWSKVRKCRIK